MTMKQNQMTILMNKHFVVVVVVFYHLFLNKQKS